MIEIDLEEHAPGLPGWHAQAERHSHRLDDMKADLG